MKMKIPKTGIIINVSSIMTIEKIDEKTLLIFDVKGDDDHGDLFTRIEVNYKTIELLDSAYIYVKLTIDKYKNFMSKSNNKFF